MVLEKTYCDADLNHNWNALFAMDDLFRFVAGHVADNFGFNYPGQEDQRVTDFIRRIKDLPRDATTI